MRPSQYGFTLVQLVCCIAVLAVLSAFAVPRFASMDQQARISAVETFAGTLNATADEVRSLCRTSASTSGCSLESASWQGTIDGKRYWLNYGWPHSGDELGTRQVDALIDSSGLHAAALGPSATRFVRSDAPAPDRCSVTYYGAGGPPEHYQLVTNVSGC
ncbi:MAG TPA: hypothetical protein VMU00_03265 [Steroidobacteraceae bacterium]|nr:hypothetical protein [Steroidobacteraceae bacterium]